MVISGKAITSTIIIIICSRPSSSSSGRSARVPSRSDWRPSKVVSVACLLPEVPHTHRAKQSKAKRPAREYKKNLLGYLLSSPTAPAHFSYTLLCCLYSFLHTTESESSLTEEGRRTVGRYVYIAANTTRRFVYSVRVCASVVCAVLQQHEQKIKNKIKTKNINSSISAVGFSSSRHFLVMERF